MYTCAHQAVTRRYSGVCYRLSTRNNRDLSLILSFYSLLAVINLFVLDRTFDADADIDADATIAAAASASHHHSQQQPSHLQFLGSSEQQRQALDFCCRDTVCTVPTWPLPTTLCC